MWNSGVESQGNLNKAQISRGNSYSTFNSQSSHQEEFSEDQNMEFVIYSKAKKPSWSCFRDIDMIDLPISGSLIALGNSMKDISTKSTRLPIKTKKLTKMSEFLSEKCQFCCQDVKINQKFVQMPCIHIIHYECIKKWTIISNPCRKCQK